MTSDDEAARVPDDAGEYAAALEAILRRIPSGWGPAIRCDRGWYALIVRLDAELGALLPAYEVHQVKQKFASLRYYVGWPEGTPEDVKVQMRQVIRSAEEECSQTCERCGKPGVFRHRPGGVKTLCDPCGAELGFEPVAVNEAGRAYVARLNERFRNPVYSGCTPINKDERRTRDA